MKEFIEMLKKIKPNVDFENEEALVDDGILESLDIISIISEIASGRVQTRDGQYVLRLENGDNTLFAQIDTDMTLTDKEFRLEYSEDLNVLPE